MFDFGNTVFDCATMIEAGLADPRMKIKIEEAAIVCPVDSRAGEEAIRSFSARLFTRTSTSAGGRIGREKSQPYWLICHGKDQPRAIF